jgi:hypothetical protein
VFFAVQQSVRIEAGAWRSKGTVVILDGVVPKNARAIVG